MAWMDHINFVKRVHMRAVDKAGKEHILVVSESLFEKIKKFAHEAIEVVVGEAAFLRQCVYNQRDRAKRFKRSKMRYKR